MVCRPITSYFSWIALGHKHADSLSSPIFFSKWLWTQSCNSCWTSHKNYGIFKGFLPFFMAYKSTSRRKLWGTSSWSIINCVVKCAVDIQKDRRKRQVSMLRNKNSIVRCWAIKNVRLSATEKKMLLFSFNIAFYKRKTLARIMKQMEINNVILCNMT